jgi:RNA polymerase sigma-70 factor (ECF subfamily)
MSILENIYRKTYQRLVSAVFALTGDLPESQDCVQEAFAQAAKKPEPVLSARNAEAWLRTASLNIARSRFRRRKRLELLMQRMLVPSEVEPASGPERLTVLQAIRQLPPEQAETIALFYLADLPVGEIAATRHVPTGTVKARLARARTRLATILLD